MTNNQISYTVLSLTTRMGRLGVVEAFGAQVNGGEDDAGRGGLRYSMTKVAAECAAFNEAIRRCGVSP